MSKRIRNILKNKMVVSGVIVATTVAIGVASTKRTNTGDKIKTQVAQVEELNKTDEKDTVPNVENKIEAKIVEANISETNTNEDKTKADVKIIKKPLSIKKVVKPITTQKIAEKINFIKKTPIKIVDTKENEDLLNQRDSLNKEKSLSNQKVDDNLTDKIVKNIKTEKPSISNENLEKIKELENKIKTKKENLKGIILHDLDDIKAIIPKTIEEMANISNKVINANENAKAYNKIILDDKKSTEEMKKEAEKLLETANKELKRVTLLAESLNNKSKDLTWNEYLTNLYNYTSGEVSKVYNYFIEEGTKAYNDILESATKAYNTSKNAYNTSVYTYNNFDNVKEAAKDLSQISGVIGVLDKETGEVLNSVKPFVKEYKPTDSYLDIVKEKANGVMTFVNANLSKNDIKLNNSDKKNTSVITPITNIVDNVSDFTNSKVNKIKNTVDLSNNYVNTKNTTKNLINSVWNLFKN